MGSSMDSRSRESRKNQAIDDDSGKFLSCIELASKFTFILS